MDYGEYPLHLLQELELLHKKIRGFVESNSSDLTIVKEEPFEIIIKGRSPKFYCHLYNPRLAPTNKCEIIFERVPESPVSTGVKVILLPFDSCINILERWLDLIKGYSSVRLTKDEEILRQSQHEFFEEINVLDEDAATASFKLPQQLLIYKYLEHIEKVLGLPENKSPEVDTIKEQARELKNDLQNLTKKETIQRLSRVLAKVRKAGIKLLSQVWDEAKKEVIKTGIKYVTDHSGDISHFIHGLF